VTYCHMGGITPLQVALLVSTPHHGTSRLDLFHHMKYFMGLIILKASMHSTVPDFHRETEATLKKQALRVAAAELLTILIANYRIATRRTEWRVMIQGDAVAVFRKTPAGGFSCFNLPYLSFLSFSCGTTCSSKHPD